MLPEKDSFVGCDEPDLVELYFARNEDAIRITQQRHGAYCYRIAHGILRDDSDARECENDGYLRAWEAVPPAVPLCFRTFLGKILRNLALDRKKKKNAKKRVEQETLLLRELMELLPSGEDPSEDAVYGELVVLIGLFLRDLPEEPRIFFLQRYWYGLSSREIGKLFGCSEEAVRSSLYRTRQTLKKRLKQEGFEV
jgi:RNA polymerase sigma-70 factor (ECF subfamily)